MTFVGVLEFILGWMLLGLVSLVLCGLMDKLFNAVRLHQSEQVGLFWLGPLGLSGLCIAFVAILMVSMVKSKYILNFLDRCYRIFNKT